MNTEELGKAKHSTVSMLFDKSLSILWPDGIKHDNCFTICFGTLHIKCGQKLSALIALLADYIGLIEYKAKMILLISLFQT